MAQKRGHAEALLERLAGCIDKGRNLVAETQKQVAGYVVTVREVDALLDPKTNQCRKRKQLFGVLVIVHGANKIKHIYLSLFSRISASYAVGWRFGKHKCFWMEQRLPRFPDLFAP